MPSGADPTSTKPDTESSTAVQDSVPNQGAGDDRSTGRQWRTVRFDVLEKIDRMPSLNSIVYEFLEFSNQEFISGAGFEAVICKDTALVARLLKVANSGFYGRARSIKSIAEAIVLIGLEHLKKLVYAVSSEGLTRKHLEHYDYHVDGGFWLHNMGVALAARALAERAPNCLMRGEEAFVAGLLHDIGKLVLDDYLDSPGGTRVSRAEEIAAVGLDHAELAEHIFKQWNLPENITTSVRYHHNYREGDTWFPGAAVLNMAEGLCEHWEMGRTSPLDLSAEVPRDPFTGLMAELGIPEGQWEQLIWDIRQDLVGCEDLYGIGS